MPAVRKAQPMTVQNKSETRVWRQSWSSTAAHGGVCNKGGQLDQNCEAEQENSSAACFQGKVLFTMVMFCG